MGYFLDIQPAEEPLPKKEWNAHLDYYLATKKLNPEVLEHMNEVQQWCINEIKKSFKRIDAKRTVHKLSKETGTQSCQPRGTARESD